MTLLALTESDNTRVVKTLFMTYDVIGGNKYL